MATNLTVVGSTPDATNRIEVKLDGLATLELPTVQSNGINENLVGNVTGNVAGVLTTTAAIKMDSSDASGTPGNATISKPRGRFAMAAAASAVTITNTLCAATSTVLLSKASNDATAVDFKVVPGAGSFVVTANAAATAAVTLDFVLINED